MSSEQHSYAATQPEASSWPMRPDAAASPEHTTRQQHMAEASSAPAQQHQHYSSYGFQEWQQQHQKQQPPAPAPMSYAPLTMPPQQVPANKPWDWTKLALTIAVLVFSICGLALGLSLLGASYNLASDDEQDTRVYVIVVGSPIYGLAIIWSAAELITQAVHRFKSGIHPGAHVGLYLVLWLASVVVAGLLAAIVAIQNSEDNDDYYDGYYGESTSYRLNHRRHGYHRGVIITDIVFMALLFLVTFVLFVCACIDTHKRNRLGRSPQYVVMDSSAWVPAAMAQGWQPPQHYFQPSPYASPMQENKGPMHGGPTNASEGPTRVADEGAEASSPATQRPEVVEYYNGGR